MLKYPLTSKQLLGALSQLSVSKADIELCRPSKHWQEAYVSKDFSLGRIQKFLKAAGFEPTGTKESLCFVNEDKTIGVSLEGTRIHVEKNLFTRFCMLIQARKSENVKPPNALIAL